MTVGFYNGTQITWANITDVSTNLTSPIDFLVRVNYIIFDGWLWFIICLTLNVILFFSMQSKNDQPLNNILYSCSIVTLISFLLRAINATVLGVNRAMLTDSQMWVFPIITALAAGIIWAIKE